MPFCLTGNRSDPILVNNQAGIEVCWSQEEVERLAAGFPQVLSSGNLYGQKDGVLTSVLAHSDQACPGMDFVPKQSTQCHMQNAGSAMTPISSNDHRSNLSIAAR